MKEKIDRTIAIHVLLGFIVMMSILIKVMMTLLTQVQMMLIANVTLDINALQDPQHHSEPPWLMIKSMFAKQDTDVLSEPVPN